MSDRRSVSEAVASVGYRSGARLARAAPEVPARRLAMFTARILSTAMPSKRAMVARHQRRVRGWDLGGRDARRAVRAVFESYARYWFEAFRLPEETPETIEARMTVEGLGYLEEAFAQGRGVVLTVPHLGGWDFGGAWLAQRGFRPVAVAEVLEPPDLFEWFVEWRRRLGVEIVPIGPDAANAVLDAVRKGKTVALVSDRDLTGAGVEVEFFGERTRLPAGPATLGLRTGAAVLPCAIYFEGDDRHHGIVMPPLETDRRERFRTDVARVTQDLAQALEELIRRAPEQWHLMQPNWPSDPGYGS